jgi:hypothetical protein
LIGPGKYDDLCTHVRQQVATKGVVVIVLEGTRGNGFGVQLEPAVRGSIVEVLRAVADQIEREAAAAESN